MTAPPAFAPRRNWKLIFDVSVSLAMLAAAAVLVWTTLDARSARRPPAPRNITGEVVEVGGAPTLGSPAAPLGIVAYSSYQCRFCAQFEQRVMDELKAAYFDSGQAMLVLRHFEPPSPLMTAAVGSAHCAARQGKFWPMHRSLLTSPLLADVSEIDERAHRAGLDLAAFAACRASSPPPDLTGGANDAQALGLTSTPVFLLGSLEDGGTKVRVKRVLRGSGNFKTFAAALAAVAGQSPEKR